MTSPTPWILALLGILAVWSGASLDVLAIGDIGHETELGWSTAEGIAILASIIVVTRYLAEDRTTGLATALAASPLGSGGHVVGRCSGGILAGASIALLPILCSVALSNHNTLEGQLSLHITVIWSSAGLLAEILLVGAWAALLAHVLPPAPAVAASVGVVALGRLLPVPVVLGILPRPVASASSGDGAVLLSTFAVEVVAAAGVLLLAAAKARRVAND